jgi:hypothetical protein
MSAESNIDHDDTYVVIGDYGHDDREVKLARTLADAEDIIHDMKLFEVTRIRGYRVFADPDGPGQTLSENIDQLNFDEAVLAPKAEAVS